MAKVLKEIRITDTVYVLVDEHETEADLVKQAQSIPKGGPLNSALVLKTIHDIVDRRVEVTDVTHVALEIQNKYPCPGMDRAIERLRKDRPSHYLELLEGLGTLIVLYMFFTDQYDDPNKNDHMWRYLESCLDPRPEERIGTEVLVAETLVDVVPNHPYPAATVKRIQLLSVAGKWEFILKYCGKLVFRLTYAADGITYQKGDSLPFLLTAYGRRCHRDKIENILACVTEILERNRARTAKPAE